MAVSVIEWVAGKGKDDLIVQEEGPRAVRWRLASPKATTRHLPKERESQLRSHKA